MAIASNRRDSPAIVLSTIAAGAQASTTRTQVGTMSLIAQMCTRLDDQRSHALYLILLMCSVSNNVSVIGQRNISEPSNIHNLFW